MCFVLHPVAISGAPVELKYFACQVLGPRYLKWESDYRRRRQQADLVHF